MSDLTKRTLGLALIGVLVIAIAVLVLLAFRAVSEWRRSTTLLVEHRSQEVLALLAVALARDMKGVQSSVLAPINDHSLDVHALYNLADIFARAFARFPYPDSFFVWHDDGNAAGVTYAFNRSDRPPAWQSNPLVGDAYPVSVVPNPDALKALLEQARDIPELGRFVMFESSLSSHRYQVIVHRLYHTTGGRRLLGMVGFTVDLEWARTNYFPDLVRQVARIGGDEHELSLAIIDDNGQVVTATGGPKDLADYTYSRRFPLVFLDAGVLTSRSPSRATVREWTARAKADGSRSFAAAGDGSAQALWLVSFAAVGALLSLALALAAVRANIKLAAMRSEFVSSVTHELKTPLALIQLVGDTLAAGRYSSVEAIREYARLLADESERLRRLIDNLLAYASVTDVKQLYRFEPLSVASVVEQALERFDARLGATGLDIEVAMPSGLPRIRGDRNTLVQVFDNIFDNAIKYSQRATTIVVAGSVVSRKVQVTVTDDGCGIPAEEVEQVFGKLYRGRGMAVPGSGLGLAIVRRTIEAHGGEVVIRSTEGRGTTVEVRLPSIDAETAL